MKKKKDLLKLKKQVIILSSVYTVGLAAVFANKGITNDFKDTIFAEAEDNFLTRQVRDYLNNDNENNIIELKDQENKRLIEQQNYDNKVKNEIKMNYINYYKNIFGIDNKTINNYLKENNIDGTDEINVLNAYYDLYFNQKVKTKNEENYKIQKTPEELINKYSNLYGINKDIALTITYCECGQQVDSYDYLVNNNPAGLGPHLVFKNKELGFIYYTHLLKNFYKCDKNSDEKFLYKIAPTYCETPNEWLDITLPIYKQVKDNYYLNNKKEKTLKKIN